MFSPISQVFMRSGIEFVTILDDYLKRKGLSRKQFCNLTDIPESTIGTWKSRNVMPSVELVAKVARFMNVSLDWLVFGEQFDDADKDNVLENPYSRRSILYRIEIALRGNYEVSIYNFEALYKRYLSDIVDYEVLLNWVSGKANMPERVLPEIAKKLNTSLQWLLTQEGDKGIDPEGYLYGLAQTYPKLLKRYNTLDEKDKEFIDNFIDTKYEISQLKQEKEAAQKN